MIEPIGYPQRLAKLIQQLRNSNTLGEVATDAQAVRDALPDDYVLTETGLRRLQDDARIRLSKPAAELVLFIQWMEAQGISVKSASDGAAALEAFAGTLGSLFGTSKADAEITQRAFAAAWAGRGLPMRPRTLYSQTIHYQPGDRYYYPRLPVPLVGLEIPPDAKIKSDRCGSNRPGWEHMVTEYIYITFPLPGSSDSVEQACLKFHVVTNTERWPTKLVSHWFLQGSPLTNFPQDWLGGLEKFLANQHCLPGFGDKLLSGVRQIRKRLRERSFSRPTAPDMRAILRRVAKNLAVGRLNHPDLNALARLAAEHAPPSTAT